LQNTTLNAGLSVDTCARSPEPADISAASDASHRAAANGFTLASSKLRTIAGPDFVLSARRLCPHSPLQLRFPPTGPRTGLVCGRAAHAAPTRGSDVPEREQQMIRKTSLTLVAAVGVFWLASTFVLGYSTKTQAVDNLTNSFRPAFTNASIAQGDADIKVAKNFAQQFQTQAAPALAKQVNLTPEQFVQAVSTQYPAVGQGLTQLPQILTYFDTVQRTIAAQQTNFHQADAIPTKSLPNTAVHWMFVILGITALAAGGSALVLRRRIVAVMAGVLGVGVIATTLILSVPAKTHAVDNMTAAFRPIFTTQSTEQARSYIATLHAMDTQLTAEALPGLAAMLKVTPQQFTESLASAFPEIATGLQELPAILGRIDTLVTTVSDNIDNFTLADAIPTRTLSATGVEWQLAIPAAVLIIAATGLGVGEWRREGQVTAERRHAVIPAGV
jgi:hypothetical protein